MRYAPGSSVFVAALCALATLAARPADDEPKLTVNAQRLHMIPPVLKGQGYAKRVDFRARLDGDADDMEPYYCLDEIWDWGDGTESIHEPDCDPYEEGVEIKRDFSDAHHFGPGTWFVSFALMHLDEVVLDARFEIRIY